MNHLDLLKSDAVPIKRGPKKINYNKAVDPNYVQVEEKVGLKILESANDISNEL